MRLGVIPSLFLRISAFSIFCPSLPGPSSLWKGPLSLGIMHCFPLRCSPTHLKMWLHPHRLSGLAGKRQRKKDQDSNAVYREATWVRPLLPLYENNSPLTRRPYDCRAGANAAILSMSKLRLKEGCGLIEVSQIVAGEDADTVSPRDGAPGGFGLRMLTLRWMSWGQQSSVSAAWPERFWQAARGRRKEQIRASFTWSLVTGMPVSSALFGCSGLNSSSTVRGQGCCIFVLPIQISGPPGLWEKRLPLNYGRWLQK